MPLHLGMVCILHFSDMVHQNMFVRVLVQAVQKIREVPVAPERFLGLERKSQLKTTITWTGHVR